MAIRNQDESRCKRSRETEKGEYENNFFMKLT